jgi:Tfp pilus assembly protein PilW
MRLSRGFSIFEVILLLAILLLTGAISYRFFINPLYKTMHGNIKNIE